MRESRSKSTFNCNMWGLILRYIQKSQSRSIFYSSSWKKRKRYFSSDMKEKFIMGVSNFLNSPFFQILYIPTRGSGGGESKESALAWWVVWRFVKLGDYIAGEKFRWEIHWRESRLPCLFSLHVPSSCVYGRGIELWGQSARDAKWKNCKFFFLHFA